MPAVTFNVSDNTAEPVNVESPVIVVTPATIRFSLISTLSIK